MNFLSPLGHSINNQLRTLSDRKYLYGRAAISLKKCRGCATFLMREKGSRRKLQFAFEKERLGASPTVIFNYTSPKGANGQQRVTLSVKGKSGSNVGKKPPPSGLVRLLNDLVKKITQKDTQRLFAMPVTEEIAPGYSNVIKTPIDMSIIKIKVHDDEYEDLRQFRDDMYLMFQNCLTYNPPGTYVYSEGENLFNFFRRALKQAKKQLNGEAGTSDLSSVARSAAGREAIEGITRTITGVDIPVVFEKVVPPVGHIPTFATPDDPTSSAFYYVDHPPNELEESVLRCQAGYEMISNSARARNRLLLLRNQFTARVVHEAFREMVGVHPSCEIDEHALEHALSQDGDTMDGLAVGSSPIGIDSIHALGEACPGLALECAKEISPERDHLRERNLRLMLFYNNCMKHWVRTDLEPAKQRAKETIRQNITKIALQLRPVTFVKERSDLRVIQHTVQSVP